MPADEGAHQDHPRQERTKRAEIRDSKTVQGGPGNGLARWQDACPHNKIIIIDRDTVITGSFTFTYSAEKRDAENLLIIPSGDLAGLYTDNFLTHRRHSKRY